MSKNSKALEPVNGRRRSLWVVWGTVIAALIIGLVLLARPTRDATLDSNLPPGEDSQNFGELTARRTSTLNFGSGRNNTSALPNNDDVSTNTIDNTSVSTSTVPERTESDPVAFYVDDFRQYRTVLDEYTIEGLVQTAEGLALPPPDDPESTEPRIGTLISPLLSLTMPSNAVSPIWRIREAPDSGVNIEVALSSDGENFTEFTPVGTGDGEIAQFFPDGSPNPNYGAIAGGIIAHGNSLYTHAVYRLTMTAGAPKSPVLEEVKLFHTDSTMGKGTLAEVPPPTGTDTWPVDAPPLGPMLDLSEPDLEGMP